MPFTRSTALKARWRKGGLHRAAFWRKQGFPNLALARAAYAKMRQERKLAKEQASQIASNRPLLDSTRDDNY